MSKSQTLPRPSLSDLSLAANTVRFLAVDAIEKSKSGHPGAPMGQAEIAVELFANHLNYDPADPHWPNRDRFVLSCGHASMLIYSMLHLTGYNLSIDDLKDFRQWGSKTPGHPEVGHTEGVETTTGPLGQGIGNAVGLALASKLAGARVNQPGTTLIDYNVYGICSDGDLMEGVSYEAASIAGHQKLDNLVMIYDNNHITIDGTTELSFAEDVALRFQGLGWHTQSVDGHDIEALRSALELAKSADRPALILARTHIGKGSPAKENTSASHGAPLGSAEVVATKTALNWPLEPSFYVPEAARDAFAPQVAAGQKARTAWTESVKALSPTQKTALDTLLARSVPADLLEQLAATVGDETVATRVSGGQIQQHAAALVPALVGGSADLAASVKTRIKNSGDIGPGHYGERNFNFGVREHGMGSVMNGLALSGFFIPFGSTFLIFSDYVRPPMRLAALMKQQAIYIFTHDSIFLGEDGPTHQPVEQLWSMRMVPDLDVVRPADALECAFAWSHAVERRDGPTALSLTRHNVPALKRRGDFTLEELKVGAYVVNDVSEPDLVLIATGGEVSVALEASERLAAQGKKIRIVSMPCVDLFLRQPAAVQARVLPANIRRASFELGITMPWKALTGLDGINIGVDTFGASAPWTKLAEEYRVNVEHVVLQLQAEL